MSRFALAKTYQTDTKMETEGVWIPSGTTPDGKTISFKIRRAGGANKEYRKSLVAGFKPITAQIKADVADEAVVEKIALKSFVQTVLVDWENVQDTDGNDIPFSPENAIEMLTDMPDLYVQLSEASQKMALFRAEVVKAAVGN